MWINFNKKLSGVLKKKLSRILDLGVINNNLRYSYKQGNLKIHIAI